MFRHFTENSRVFFKFVYGIYFHPLHTVCGNVLNFINFLTSENYSVWQYNDFCYTVTVWFFSFSELQKIYLNWFLFSAFWMLTFVFRFLVGTVFITAHKNFMRNCFLKLLTLLTLLLRKISFIFFVWFLPNYPSFSNFKYKLMFRIKKLHVCFEVYFTFIF